MKIKIGQGTTKIHVVLSNYTNLLIKNINNNDIHTPIRLIFPGEKQIQNKTIMCSQKKTAAQHSILQQLWF